MSDLRPKSMLRAAAHIPDGEEFKERTPMVVLVDISGSTSRGGDQADIHFINGSLARLVEVFRDDRPGTPLHKRALDVSVITYSGEPQVQIPWTPRQDLPTVAPEFQSQQFTYTGKALTFTLEYIATQLRFYRDNGVDWGIPNIIHITDGHPTDMKPGEPLWEELRTRLSYLTDESTAEKVYAHFLTFVSPMGLHDGGSEIMRQLSGPDTVYDIEQGTQAVENLVNIVVAITKAITAPYGAKTSVAAAQAHIQAVPNAGVKPRQRPETGVL